MTTQPEQPDQTDAPAPFWTETPSEFFGRTLIDPAIDAAGKLSQQNAENPDAVTKVAAGALSKMDAAEDRLDERLQSLDQAMDRAVDKALSPVLHRLERSSLVDRILDWWLNIGKPKTDEARVEAWVSEHPAELHEIGRAVQRGEKSPAWATAFVLAFAVTPRDEDVDPERVSRLERLILQRANSDVGS